MPNTIYIEPSSGVAGDMFLSALCSLANAYDEILALPDKLHLHDGKIEVNELNKNGIVCKHINIIDTGESPHSHSHGSHSHSHGEHRHLSDIIKLIEAGHISDNAKRIAKDIFTIIGKSEATIHGIPIETIHFHEVSGVDSILDIVGCAVLIDKLDIKSCYSDSVCVGYGKVDTQHGVLPVPAPATADILIGIPTYKGSEAGERSTPTGAAILKYLNPKFESPNTPATKIAYGPGQKDFEEANVLRISLLNTSPNESSNQVWVIETNIDDMSGEMIGNDFQSLLLESGAIDFSITHTQMKKGRPAFILSAMAHANHRDSVIDCILEHTSTIGLRYYTAQRKILERRKVVIETEFGPIEAKESTKPSGAKTTKWEYESLKDIASKKKISLVELKDRLGQD